MFRQNGNKKYMYVWKLGGKNQCCESGSGRISLAGYGSGQIIPDPSSFEFQMNLKKTT